LPALARKMAEGEGFESPEELSTSLPFIIKGLHLFEGP
jgi:hypothetical protein